MAQQIIVKGVVWAGLGFLSYELYESYKQEKKIKKLQAMKQYQISNGIEVSPEINNQIKEYMDSHYGQKVLERMGTRNLLEEQIKLQIQQKKENREKMAYSGASEEVLRKLDEDIKKLDDLFAQIKHSKNEDFVETTAQK